MPTTIFHQTIILILFWRHLVAEKCDIFTGEWIADKSGPAYTDESCNVIESHQNCLRNGRPDSDYLFWRWRPLNCEVPRFNSERFLDLMRNKSWAFVGDSISRNHVQSLLCILSQVHFNLCLEISDFGFVFFESCFYVCFGCELFPLLLHSWLLKHCNHQYVLYAVLKDSGWS